MFLPRKGTAISPKVEAGKLEAVTRKEVLRTSKPIEIPDGGVNWNYVFSDTTAAFRCIRHINENTLSPNIITLKFLNPTWIQLRDTEDRIVISQLMTENDEYSYDIKLNYNLTAGNAGNILVSINGEVKGKVGKKGEVIDSLVISSDFNN